MFKVGDKVVWVGEGPVSWDTGAEGVVTREHEGCGDETCCVRFTTGQDAGRVVYYTLAKNLMHYDDYMKTPTGNTIEKDVLKEIEKHNRVVSVVSIPERNRHKKNKYDREIVPGVWVDVYDLLAAWEVPNPALQHLIKKALQAGDRGHKDLETDLQDIIDSAIRAKQLEGF